MLASAAMSLFKHKTSIIFLVLYSYAYLHITHAEILNYPCISIYNDSFTLIPNNTNPSQRIAYQLDNNQNITSSSINMTYNIIAIGESGYNPKINILNYNPILETISHTTSITLNETEDFISITSLQWFNNDTKLMACIRGAIFQIIIFSYENNTLSELASTSFTQSAECIEITPSGNFIALAHANQLTIYAVTENTIEVINSFNLPSYVSCIAWAPDEQYIAIGVDDTLAIYAVTSQETTLVTTTSCYFFNQSIYWSDNMDYIAIGSCKPTCQDNIISPNGCTIFSFNETQLQPVT